MINADKLTFSYPGNTGPTLKEISFDIARGEIFGFLGPSGAGKSTTQKILYKILTDYTGTVTIDGQDLRTWDKAYFEKIGVGFELPNHYQKLSGRENMALFRDFYSNGRGKKVEELFNLVGLMEAIDKPVSAYSKGMQVRLNFIRAIQHDPDIIFFDEPTAGLDPINARIIRKHIKELGKAGKTIFVTTHSMYSADELCDRVAFIADGELMITDAPDTLKLQYGKKGVRVEPADGQPREFPLKELGSNEQFLAYIRGKDISRIHTMEATLEDVFVKVTGKSLQQ